MTVRTQTKSPSTVVSDDSVGTVAWADPEGAESESGAAANATGPGISEWLKCTGYGFTVPSNAAPRTLTPLVRRSSLAAFTSITMVAASSVSSANGSPGAARMTGGRRRSISHTVAFERGIRFNFDSSIS